MGFLHFLLMLLVTIALAAGAVWVLKRFYPEVPTWAPQIIWGLALLIIVYTLLTVTGVWDTLVKYDPKIPSMK